MAASDYFNQIQQLYVAYFGRPADPEGLSYWAAEANINGSLGSVISNFAISAESNTLFGNLSTAQLVTAIYANVFNREPEAEGLAYWTSQIDSGAISSAQAAWTILQSAGTEDTKAVQNKLAAANAFTGQVDTPAEIAGYAGATALAHGRAFLAAIDGTTASMDNLQANAVHAVTIATGTEPAPAPALPVQPPIFSATEHAGVVSFSGSATGDITVTWSGAVGNSEATFSRGGVAAAPINFAGGAVSSITLDADDILKGSASTLSGLTTHGAGGVVLSVTLDNLANPTFSANSTHDELIVNTMSYGTYYLNGLTGFESIQLHGSGYYLDIADGAGTTVTATDPAVVVLGAGGQTFYGNSGWDEVYGGTGNDTLSGGAGDDDIWGEAGDDTLSGGAGDDDISGDDGDDTISGDDGDDYINGGDGNDTIWGGAGDDYIWGGDGYNTIYGDAGDDTIDGGNDNDLIYGGAGNDDLYGGGGNDTFAISGVTLATNGLDTIQDFTPGADKIQFNVGDVHTATGASLTAGAVAASNFFSGPGATTDTEFFIYDKTTGNLSFDADGNGSGVAVVLVTLVGKPDLAAADIVLV